MKLAGTNEIILSPRELSGLVMSNPKTVERAKDLIMRRAQRRRKPQSRRRYLRITDHQTYKLLRIDPEFQEKITAHALILDLWARLPEGKASVEVLLERMRESPVQLNVPKPIAWIRLVVKQAVLRGDAITVPEEALPPLPL